MKDLEYKERRSIMARIPYVIEGRGKDERVYDLYSRILRDRIIFLSDNINDQVSNSIVAQLLFLASQDSESDIYMYINSPGGLVTSGLAIYDTMQYIKPDVHTICVGQAASMAAVLLAAGTEGKRSALQHSRLLLHQPVGGTSGQVSDIEIQTNEILRIKDAVYDILVKHTGQTKKKIKKDSDRDYFLSAKKAVEYGLIDKVMDERNG